MIEQGTEELVSFEAKQQKSGKSYSYEWKSSLFNIVIFFGLGLLAFSLDFTKVSSHALLSAYMGQVLGIAFLLAGLYACFCKAEIHFDGESQTFSQRFYFAGKLSKETIHPFSDFESVSVIEKLNRRARRNPFFKSYVIALSHGGKYLPLCGVAFSKEKHQERRDAIAEVLGLP